MGVMLLQFVLCISVSSVEVHSSIFPLAVLYLCSLSVADLSASFIIQ